MSTPAEIVNLLRAASTAYHNGGELKMDDDTYDGILERLREMDPYNPYLEEVGAPSQSEGVVKLPWPMPSLDKIKPGEDSLRRFLGFPGGFAVSEKLDGISALWLPETQRLLLRGDGLNGQDVSHLVPLGIQGLSKRCPLHVAVRGELILPRNEGVSLARSWVNGQLHQKTPTAAECKRIHFVAYELMGISSLKRGRHFSTLRGYGFEIPWWTTASVLTEANLESMLQERRVKSAYDTDGLVIGHDTVPKSESTPTRARNPKDCVAFKMSLADQSAETTVTNVLWAPSAQGYLIPRIQFTPVKIGAATIEFCTGHNARTIYQQSVGPGAKIMVRRSGDVIPKLDRVITPASVPSFPPVGSWAWDGDSSSSAHIKTVLTNDETIGAKLHHFLKTLEIPGTGPATAKALVGAGIKTPLKLWKSSVETLSEIIGPKTGAGLYANLRTILAKVDELTLMLASSLMPRGVGDTKLKGLFAVETDPRKWNTISPPTGWTSSSFEAFLAEFPEYVVWRKQELGHIPYPILDLQKESISPKSIREYICLSGFRDKDLEEKADQRGYKVLPNLTAKVTILLVPDGEVKESEKVKMAKAKGIKILSRAQFLALHL